MSTVPRKFIFVSLFPELVKTYFSYGVLARAQRSGLIDATCIQLRQFAVDRHGTVDGRPYGGGEGMVMRADALAAAVDSLGEQQPLVIVPSPSGRLWTSVDAQRLAADQRAVIFICPRFSGVDQRFVEQYQAEEYSLGDFVVSGGELPAILFADSIARFAPGVLGDQESATKDSFGEGMDGILEYPIYTRPEVLWDKKVPEVLTSGDHQAIVEWREQQSLLRTQQRRPDLLT